MPDAASGLSLSVSRSPSLCQSLGVSLSLSLPPRVCLRDQSLDFFGGNDAEAATPVLWPPHSKSQLIGKDPDAGKDRRQEEKGMLQTPDYLGRNHAPSSFLPTHPSLSLGSTVDNAINWKHKVLHHVEK